MLYFFHSSLSLYIATYLSLQATFLNVIQCAVCWKMQHRANINTRPFLNTKQTQLTFKTSTPPQTRDSEISAQDTAQKWLQYVASTGRSLHSPYRNQRTLQQCMWISVLQYRHMRFTASLPAHPLLRMNDYSTDQCSKMLLMLCMNNPGWIQRCLFSLAYFSQVHGARMRWEGDAWRKTTLGTFDDTGQYAASSRVMSHASHSKCVWGQICLLGQIAGVLGYPVHRIHARAPSLSLSLSPCALNNAEDTAVMGKPRVRAWARTYTHAHTHTLTDTDTLVNLCLLLSLN